MASSTVVLAHHGHHSDETGQRSPTKPLTFRDLPLEIRNQIYGYLLISDFPIQILWRRDHKPRTSSDFPCEDLSGNDESSDDRGVEYFVQGPSNGDSSINTCENKEDSSHNNEDSSGPIILEAVTFEYASTKPAICVRGYAYQSASSIDVALLRVSRSFLQETTAILYGENVFYFDQGKPSLCVHKPIAKDAWSKLCHFTSFLPKWSSDHIRKINIDFPPTCAYTLNEALHENILAFFLDFLETHPNVRCLQFRITEGIIPADFNFICEIHDRCSKDCLVLMGCQENYVYFKHLIEILSDALRSIESWGWKSLGPVRSYSCGDPSEQDIIDRSGLLEYINWEPE